MNRGWHSKLIAGEAINVGNRYILPIYTLGSFSMGNSFLADLSPKGFLNIERDQVFYSPVDGDEMTLDQLYSKILGLEDLITGLKSTL